MLFEENPAIGIKQKSSTNNYFYKHPPQGQIPLTDFNLIAYERIQILYEIEKIGYNCAKPSQKYYETIDSEIRKIRKELIQKYPSLNQYKEDFREHLSHFIMRLCFCKTEDLKKWLITNEVDYFKYKLNFHDETFMNVILKEENMSYILLNPNEKEKFAKELINSTFKSNQAKILEKDTQIFKVPFIEIPELVRKRKIFIHKGYAFVPKPDLIHIIVRRFRINISYALAYTRSFLAKITDKRILALIENGQNLIYTSVDQNKYLSKSPDEEITCDDIDNIEAHFPPCMQHLHQTLKREHKLKHWGRMQYGLFLKGLGLPLNEALKFWQMEFCKAQSIDTFQKNYAYNIRHMFGQEGKKADYTPYNCIKIIMGTPPGSQDHHGCPFKHMDTTSLRIKLRGDFNYHHVTASSRLMTVTEAQIEEIVQLVDSSHFQIACSKYFAAKHGLDPLKAPAINHPNQFYVESQKLETHANSTTANLNNSLNANS